MGIAMSAFGEGCGVLADDARPADPRWRANVGFVSGSAPGFVVGIADSGVDAARLALSQPLEGLAADAVGHGTAVASEIAADRGDLGVRGVAPRRHPGELRPVRP